MGFDVKRFVDNVNNQFICGICNGVLKNPVMVRKCQHFFCDHCIHNQINTSAVCPKDRNFVSLSQLIQPQQLIINLLNDLKIKCEFTTSGCDEVITLAKLERHQRVCEKNPLNKSLIKCFCGQKITRKESTQHKQNCLPSIKNEIYINRSQISTFISDIYNQCNQKTSSKVFRTETEFLYHKLSQSLPQRVIKQSSIENILLYLNWRLLEYNKPTNEDHNRILSGLRDLFRATLNNSEAIRTFNRLNGLDYVILVRNATKSRAIDQSITDILNNFCHSEIHLKKLMDRPVLELLMNLTHPKINGIENSFNCVNILSQIIITFNENWSELSTKKERNEILNRLKDAINGWKLNMRIRTYPSLDSHIEKLRKHLNEMPTEVLYRYLWILVHHSRANPKKYVPMIEAQNVNHLLQPLVDDSNTEQYIKDFIQLLFHQISTFNTYGHLNGLEKTDKREFIIN